MSPIDSPALPAVTDSLPPLRSVHTTSFAEILGHFGCSLLVTTYQAGKLVVVRADNGVVRLSGYVWDPSDFQTAILIAEGVEGVTGVVNNLELNRNGNDNGPVAR